MYYSLLSTFTESNQTVLTVRQRYIGWWWWEIKNYNHQQKKVYTKCKKKVTEKTEGKEK